jgi:hypothetical protein
VDERWRARFGDVAPNEIVSALRRLHGALPLDPPAYLPLAFPTQDGKAETPVARTASSSPREQSTGGDRALSELSSGVLFAFTVDFERVSRISRPSASRGQVRQLSRTV